VLTSSVVGFYCRTASAAPGQGLRIKLISFFVRVSLAGIAPVGFRVKSDLRSQCAIVQPRFYDSAMVTQITLYPNGTRPPF
jgi:hypothetical protein